MAISFHTTCDLGDAIVEQIGEEILAKIGAEHVPDDDSADCVLVQRRAGSPNVQTIAIDADVEPDRYTLFIEAVVGDEVELLDCHFGVYADDLERVLRTLHHRDDPMRG